MSRELHSSRLEHLGIARTAAALCEEVAAQHGVTVVFTNDGIPVGLPKEVALTLFRVLQEALTNAVKHSGARRIDVPG